MLLNDIKKAVKQIVAFVDLGIVRYTKGRNEKNAHCGRHLYSVHYFLSVIDPSVRSELDDYRRRGGFAA